mmetsp:Transcript_20289/g.44296  ORF Transcript_20289/g.44296 Transcript_20289/m.44296 type:complete len:342 (+) Transcript_20289:80-1105(+)
MTPEEDQKVAYLYAFASATAVNRAVLRVERQLKEQQCRNGAHQPHQIHTNLDLKVKNLTVTNLAFTGILRTSETISLSLSQRFGNPEEDTPDFIVVSAVYRALKELLMSVEVKWNIVANMPENGNAVQEFSLTTTGRLQKVIWDNPKKSLGLAAFLVGGAGAWAAGCNAAKGFCVLQTGLLKMLSCIGVRATCSCAVAAWSPLASAVVGGAVCAVGVLVIYSAWSYFRPATKVDPSAPILSPEEMEAIQREMNQLRNFSAEELVAALKHIQDELEAAFTRDAEANLDDVGRCFICLDEREAVEAAVKPSLCRGNHWMCREHLANYTVDWQDRCCICNRGSW